MNSDLHFPCRDTLDLRMILSKLTCVRPRLALITAITVVAAIPAHAQPPQPVVGYIFPAGAQQGKTVEATVHGKDLQNAAGVRSHRSGRHGQDRQGRRSYDGANLRGGGGRCRAGRADLRLLTPGGISNRVRFFIGEPAGSQRGRAEQRSGQTPDPRRTAGPDQRPDPRQRPRLLPFHAKKGQTIVCACRRGACCRIFPIRSPASSIPASRCLIPPARRWPGLERFRHRPDSLLVYTIPQDGDYTLEIRDVIYRGRADFIYRLAVGDVSISYQRVSSGQPARHDGPSRAARHRRCRPPR